MVNADDEDDDSIIHSDGQAAIVLDTGYKDLTDGQTLTENALHLHRQPSHPYHLPYLVELVLLISLSFPT